MTSSAVKLIGLDKYTKDMASALGGCDCEGEPNLTKREGKLVCGNCNAYFGIADSSVQAS